MVLPHIWACETRTTQSSEAILLMVLAKTSILDHVESSMPKVGKRIGLILKGFPGFVCYRSNP